MIKKIYEIKFYVKCLCYIHEHLLGFYSSLSDKLGPNGDLFLKRSEIMKLMLNQIKFPLIMPKLIYLFLPPVVMQRYNVHLNSLMSVLSMKPLHLDGWRRRWRLKTAICLLARGWCENQGWWVYNFISHRQAWYRTREYIKHLIHYILL